MLSRSIILASVLAAFADAQSSSTGSASIAASTTVSQSMPPSATAAFNPSLVNSTLAFNWCQGQRNSCPEICNGGTLQNTCDPTTFTYSCICANGTVPDCTAYIQTLPFYICQATFGQCINAHPEDAQGQQTCTDNMKCGTKNATGALLASSSGSSASSTGSGSAAASSSASSAATAASSSAAAATSSGAAIANTQQIATGAFAAVLMAAFKVFL